MIAATFRRRRGDDGTVPLAMLLIIVGVGLSGVVASSERSRRW